MTPKDVFVATAVLVESEPEKFRFVQRLELERALFEVAKDVAATQLDYILPGFNDDALAELLQRASGHQRSFEFVSLLNRIIQKVKLISSGDPYITLEGEEMILEGRREVIVSLKSDLQQLLAQLERI